MFREPVIHSFYIISSPTIYSSYPDCCALALENSCNPAAKILCLALDPSAYVFTDCCCTQTHTHTQAVCFWFLALLLFLNLCNLGSNLGRECEIMVVGQQSREKLKLRLYVYGKMTTPLLASKHDKLQTCSQHHIILLILFLNGSSGLLELQF